MASVAELKAIGTRCIAVADEIKGILHDGENKTTELIAMNAFLEGSSNEAAQHTNDALQLVHQSFDAYYNALGLYQETLETYIKSL